MPFIKPDTRKITPSVLTIAFMFITGTAAAESSQNYIQLAQTATTAAVQDGKYWIDKGWELHSAGKYEEAIQAFRKAEAMGAGSDELTFDIADTYETMGRDRDAYREFSKARNSKNPESRATACERSGDLAWARNKTLPDPYFADLYTNIGWQHMGDTAFIDMKGRIGVESGGDYNTQFYLFGKYTKDNRSGVYGGLPAEYFNNAAIVGLGLQQSITDHLSFWAEAGRAREFLDVGRDRYDDDVRGGFEYYRNWYTDVDCRSNDKYPNRFILKTYAELVYYSRFDDAVWFNAKVRPGLRVYETPKSTVDTYLVLGVNQNLEDSSDNYNEAGLQVEWYPDHQRDFSISAKAVEYFYIGDEHEFNFIIEFEHYINW